MHISFALAWCLMIIGCLTEGRGAQDLTSCVKACGFVSEKAESGVQLQADSAAFNLSAAPHSTIFCVHMEGIHKQRIKLLQRSVVFSPTFFVFPCSRSQR